MRLSAFFGQLFSAFWQDFTAVFSLSEWRMVLKKLLETPFNKRLSNWKWLPLQLLLYYLLLSPVVAMPFYNILLFHPSKTGQYDVSSIGGVKKQDCFFPSQNGLKLHAWYFPTPYAVGTVLLSHGNGGNLAWRADLVEILIRAKFAVFIYDYQGYGYSQGRPSINNICDDALSAYDYLASKPEIVPSKLVLYGESLGGGAACYVAERRPSAGLILQSTFSSLPHVAEQRFLYLRLYPRSFYPKNILDNVAAIKRAHIPVLIIQGQSDPIIPKEEAEILFHEAEKPKNIVRVPGAGHNDMYSRYADQLAAAISQFIPLTHTGN